MQTFGEHPVPPPPLPELSRNPPRPWLNARSVVSLILLSTHAHAASRTQVNRIPGTALLKVRTHACAGDY